MSEQLEKGKVSEKKHNLRMEGRTHLMMDGILDVDAFDDGTVTVKTSLGPLAVEGEGLHVKHLALESGELILEGVVGALYYTDETKSKSEGGFFSRLLR